ncbi:unnamed protein product [Effrenium voratum]|uniref:Uncharacterized protein n=1 Tax=Effrenium voratum TaxID=2562239 RepID=A0AA36IN13_9DINO|nr:unnamed protein product [Effrenium voratum]CAJ1420819.1 unnamed protein product [Effrenium voratum]
MMSLWGLTLLGLAVAQSETGAPMQKDSQLMKQVAQIRSFLNDQVLPALEVLDQRTQEDRAAIQQFAELKEMQLQKLQQQVAELARSEAVLPREDAALAGEVNAALAKLGKLHDSLQEQRQEQNLLSDRLAELQRNRSGVQRLSQLEAHVKEMDLLAVKYGKEVDGRLNATEGIAKRRVMATKELMDMLAHTNERLDALARANKADHLKQQRLELAVNQMNQTESQSEASSAIQKDQQQLALRLSETNEAVQETATEMHFWVLLQEMVFLGMAIAACLWRSSPTKSPLEEPLLNTECSFSVVTAHTSAAFFLPDTLLSGVSPISAKELCPQMRVRGVRGGWLQVQSASTLQLSNCEVLHLTLALDLGLRVAAQHRMVRVSGSRWETVLASQLQQGDVVLVQDAEVELLEIRREILETAEVQELRFDRSEAVCTLADDPAEFQVV